MKRVIIRVDDRLIHGQVIEGWINYFKIPNIILVNNIIANDICKRIIYEGVMPLGSKLTICTIEEFKQNKPFLKFKRGNVLIIFSSIDDLYQVQNIPTEDMYINIGCIATGEHSIKVTDTVFLDLYQLKLLDEITKNHNVYAHKLPWDNAINIHDFIVKWYGEEL